MTNAHVQILSAATRDADAVTCSSCGGGGRVSMHVYGAGSYEMGWICWTCDPDEKAYWTKAMRPSRRTWWRRLWGME